MFLITFYILFVIYLYSYIILVIGNFASSSQKTSESSAHYSRTIEDLEWQDDFDMKQRFCIVSLWTRPLKPYKHEDVTMMHWAIVVEWNHRSATYEANNEGGYLLPNWYSGLPKKPKWKEKIIQPLGIHWLSPQQVNQASFNNRLNGGKYLLGHVNCQQWVVVLTQDLGISLLQATIAQDSPLYAIGATTLGLIIGSKEALGIAGSISMAAPATTFGAVLGNMGFLDFAGSISNSVPATTLGAVIGSILAGSLFDSQVTTLGAVLKSKGFLDFASYRFKTDPVCVCQIIGSTIH